jgi:hypothetical protein
MFYHSSPLGRRKEVGYSSCISLFHKLQVLYCQTKCAPFCGPYFRVKQTTICVVKPVPPAGLEKTRRLRLIPLHQKLNGFVATAVLFAKHK